MSESKKLELMYLTFDNGCGTQFNFTFKEAQEVHEYLRELFGSGVYPQGVQMITRKQALDALALHEREYMGQDAKKLWEWALKQVIAQGKAE